MKKVAVVGLGNIATRHRRNLKQLFPDAYLYAMSASGRIPKEKISDADQLVTSINTLIEQQVQLVIIASPAPFHASHSIPLIEAGIPVLIEKPVTATIEDVHLLQEATAHHSTPVSVGYCLRYLPSAVEVKNFISSGKLGRIYHVNVEIGQYLPDWRPNKNYRYSVSARSELGGGALLELSHELDYTQWLLGDLTLEHAILRSSDELGLEVEDSADLTLTTFEKAVVHIHLDFLQRKAYRKCRFVGSDGVLEWDLILNELKLITPDQESIIYSDLTWDKNQMYLNMVRDFVNNIKGRSHVCIDLKQACRTVSLIEKIKSFTPEYMNK